MFRKLFPAAAAFCLAASLCACASPTWVKPGATQAEFAQDRYACMQQSQQRVSAAYVGQSGGAASSNMVTNGNLFDACMTSTGWALQKMTKDQRAAADEGSRASIEAIKSEVRQLCTRPDLRPFYSKTSCLPAETTLDQMTDKTKITPAEKIAFSAARTELDGFGRKIDDVFRQYYPEAAAVFIERRALVKRELDTLALEFYDGRITRGEYNRRRKEIADRNGG
jgi:hypothetical protein